MADGALHLGCATDDAFAPHTGTMLRSALLACAGTPVHVHVLHESLDAGHSEKLRQVAAMHGAAIDFHRVAASQMAGLPTQYFHRACWYRILAPDLLPAVPKLLYLDSDTIVIQPLRELWDTDVSQHLFAAVTNPLYPFMPDFPARRLGVTRKEDYINSGVLVMNLERMRAEGFTARIRAYAQAHPDNAYPEQDALSALYHGRCKLLHPRWNAQNTFFELPASQLPFPPGVTAEARDNPAIVHFIGPYKPWTYLCTHPLRGLYAQHRSNVPWPAAPEQRPTLGARLLRPMSITWRYRWTRMGELRDAVFRKLRRTLGTA